MKKAESFEVAIVVYEKNNEFSLAEVQKTFI